MVSRDSVEEAFRIRIDRRMLRRIAGKLRASSSTSASSRAPAAAIACAHTSWRKRGSHARMARRPAASPVKLPHSASPHEMPTASAYAKIGAARNSESAACSAATCTTSALSCARRAARSLVAARPVGRVVLEQQRVVEIEEESADGHESSLSTATLPNPARGPPPLVCSMLHRACCSRGLMVPPMMTRASRKLAARLACEFARASGSRRRGRSPGPSRPDPRSQRLRRCTSSGAASAPRVESVHPALTFHGALTLRSSGRHRPD